ncbi:transporter substrate-binding protein [Aestuariivirga sp.]|uniref:transporter substrate-binding protein n=1 Tax=Aestuariivirga sp. TaxID=2650926 RepID=UPI0039E5FF99
MRKAHRIGILYSTSGPYAAIGRDCRDAAEFAIAQYAAVMPGLVEPVHVDPGASLKGYVEGAITMLRDRGCRHIIGTVTSAARKEIIPVVEKHDGLLWYTCPYEGFEANPNVIYTGACPNQHLLPLFDYLLPRFGNRPYLAGANYVWGWEMNRLARELINASDGEIAGERYLPLEETTVDLLIADIEREKPSFILNNLIGPASYAFLTAMHVLALRNPAFVPERCPVVSCDLTECELGEFEGDMAVGQMSAACYFDGLGSENEKAFRPDFIRSFGPERRISSIFAATHAATALCLEAIHAIGDDEPRAVRQHLYSTTTQTVLGPVRIDATTNHAALPFHLGRINRQRGFDVLASRPAIAADPYLTAQRSAARPRLRVVS